MTPELLEQIRLNAERLVADGVSDYESRFGRIQVEEIKRGTTQLCLELTLIILERFENDEPVSIEPFKNILLDALFKLEPDVKVLGDLIGIIFEDLIKFIRIQPNFNANVELVKGIERYVELIKEYGLSFSAYLSSTGIDIIQSVPEYGNSVSSPSISPLEFDTSTRKVYTLFPKSRYWEVFIGLNEDNSYSPLDYNNFAKSRGYPQYQIPISYDTLLVYNDELYKLKPGIGTPTRTSFVEEEWNAYSSRVFNKSKSFKTLYAERIESAFRKFTENGFEVNEIISDSKIESYSPPQFPNEDTLSVTFGGVGKQLFQSIKDLNAISNSFGGYEGSPVGGIEYLTAFSEYLLSSSYGRQITEAYDTPNGESSFGRFDTLYLSKSSESEMPGLKFLEGFGRLRSFRHNQFLPKDIKTDSKLFAYNPLYAQFGGGLEDRFTSLKKFSTYVLPPRVDLLLLSIENLYRRSLYLGDAVLALTNSLDELGKPPGYEGLGSVSMQLKELQRIFPPASHVLGLSAEEKTGTGFSGSKIVSPRSSILGFPNSMLIRASPFLSSYYLSYIAKYSKHS